MAIFLKKVFLSHAGVYASTVITFRLSAIYNTLIQMHLEKCILWGLGREHAWHKPVCHYKALYMVLH